MKLAVVILTTLSLVIATPITCPDEELKHWSPEAVTILNRLISLKGNQSNYAVFDADNTIWQYDIEESSLPYLENLGVITRENLDPSLKLIAFKDTVNYTETLYSYYNRLCGIGAELCYPWAAQVYAGLTLRQLKGHVDNLMVLNQTIPTTYWDGDVVAHEEIHPPKIYTGQTELMKKLRANGIEVYIISASNEEIVRMVVSDPKYGYNVKAENVIGVATLLVNATSGDITTSRKQISDGLYNETANLDLKFGTYLWTPATWYAGKWAAILTYIDMWKKPVLAAGDTPGSDTYMLFNVVQDGVHVWVNRSASKYEQLQELITESVEGQAKNAMPVTVDKNWVVMLPTQLL